MFKLSLITISFLFTLGSANLGVRPLFEDETTIEHFECYAQNGVSLVFSTAWDPYLGAVSNFADNYHKAKTAGIASYDAVINLNDTLLPEDICGQTVHALPSEFTGRVWISFYYDWSRAVNKRMDYLDSVILTCQKHGLKMGIYSDVRTWTTVFGNPKAISGIVQALPLFYENYNDDASFNDFSSASFGAWAAPTMKGYTGLTLGFCSTVLEVKAFF